MSKEKGVNLTRFQRKDFKTCVGDAPANVKIMQPDGIGFARFLTFNGLMDGNYAASTTLYRFPFSVCIRSAPMALIILPKRTTVMPRIAAG